MLTALFRLRSGAIELSIMRYERRVERINRQHAVLGRLSDQQLKKQWEGLRSSIQNGASSEEALLRTFAVIKEAVQRTVGLQAYDEQLEAALALHDRKLVEMQTGEGKTLAAVLPACVGALQGRGVHILTFNDYLAARDVEWMGPIYRFLDLTIGHVEQGMTGAERRAAYACDVTYVTAKEAGFDFLRDQRALQVDDLVQRGFYYAIVDEADSILIDEARVPLVIAGAVDLDEEKLGRFARLVRSLRANIDYKTDQSRRNIHFTSRGLHRLQRALQCGELYVEANVELLTRLNLALQAEVLLQRDVDYLVREREIVLIDELTGRVAENRRWPYGLQAALEAKEGVAIRPQGKILNSITLQHFLQQYECICGMTGTAQEAAEEFDQFYGLRLKVIPPHRPCIRHDLPDCIFATKAAKTEAVISEVKSLHQSRVPVLVGTASVEESEELAARLIQAGVVVQVLNARNDRHEAAVVAEAGALNAVTISTNMAGRGTDIRLGGSGEHGRERVVALGGLHVLGMSRHESRRIDNQLRGRAGRQGDPGQTCFFVSIEDDLLARHGIGDLLRGCLDAGQASRLDDPDIGAAIEHVQRIVEGETFEIRRTLRKYSLCLENQRRVLQERRQRLLRGIDTPSLLRSTNPDWFSQLASKFGAEAVFATEREVTLCWIDHCWSEHLAEVAEIREGVYLLSMGGLSAIDNFNRQISEAFRRLPEQIDEGVLTTMRSLPLEGDALHWNKETLLGPSSTWTFMINDNPMGDIFERLGRSIKRLTKQLLRL